MQASNFISVSKSLRGFRRNSLKPPPHAPSWQLGTEFKEGCTAAKKGLVIISYLS